MSRVRSFPHNSYFLRSSKISSTTETQAVYVNYVYLHCHRQSPQTHIQTYEHTHSCVRLDIFQVDSLIVFVGTHVRGMENHSVEFDSF